MAHSTVNAGPLLDAIAARTSRLDVFRGVHQRDLVLLLALVGDADFLAVRRRNIIGRTTGWDVLTTARVSHWLGARRLGPAAARDLAAGLLATVRGRQDVRTSEGWSALLGRGTAHPAEVS